MDELVLRCRRIAEPRGVLACAERRGVLGVCREVHSEERRERIHDGCHRLGRGEVNGGGDRPRATRVRSFVVRGLRPSHTLVATLVALAAAAASLLAAALPAHA
jgi:hypothetical protein